MRDDELLTADGRTVGFTDHGPPSAFPVLWCHGGPGSRREPDALAAPLLAAGYRPIGIDRPGYGRSTPQSGRTIGGWVADGLAVADELGLDAFAVVGVSTGGAYALALAAAAPTRVTGVVACCALSDMSAPEVRAAMPDSGPVDLWSFPDREAALRGAAELLGEDGSRMLEQTGAVELPPADLAMLTDPEFITAFATSMKEMFAFGVQGFADDRLADGPGWGTFSVAAVSCPALVLHGSRDTIVPFIHAEHTAAIVPGAALRIVDELGHFSIMGEIVAGLEAVR